MTDIEIDSIKQKLHQHGFVVFDADNTDDCLLELSNKIGKVVPGDKGDLVQTLMAQDKGGGSYGSFTYSVGYGAFPWHTDTAYWDSPVRYLMLTSEKPSTCATLARTFDSLAANIEDFMYLAERSVFMLDIPGKRRMLTPVVKKTGLIGYRFDFHIYKPMNKEAIRLSDLMLEQLHNDSQRVIWTGHNVLLLDNWLVVHSRECAINDRSRSLKRIYINELV